MPTEPDTSVNPEHYLSKLQTICTAAAPNSNDPMNPPPPPPYAMAAASMAVAAASSGVDGASKMLPTQPLPPPPFNPLSTRIWIEKRDLCNTIHFTPQISQFENWN